MTLIVINPGVQTLIEDAGRVGLARFGVARSGAFDLQSWRTANQLVGNALPSEDDDCGPASLEVLLGGLELMTTQRVTLAVAGADMAASAIDSAGNSQELWQNARHTVEANTTIKLRRAKHGLRAYVAFSGGLDCPTVLGSRSYDTTAQLGPLPLVAGTQLPILSVPVSQPQDHRSGILTVTRRTNDAPLHLSLGPDAAQADLDLITARMWRVKSDSNRTGVRLVQSENETTDHRPASTQSLPSAAALPSAPALPGTVQALPNGELVVFGPDAPTTGGYPVAAVMDRTSLSALGQRRPGDVVVLRE